MITSQAPSGRRYLALARATAGKPSSGALGVRKPVDIVGLPSRPQRASPLRPSLVSRV